MNEWTFVRLAYGVAWTALSVYFIYLRRRQTRAQARLETLES